MTPDIEALVARLEALADDYPGLGLEPFAAALREQAATISELRALDNEAQHGADALTDRVAEQAREIERLRVELRSEQEGHSQLQSRCYDQCGTFSNVFDECTALKAERDSCGATLAEQVGKVMMLTALKDELFSSETRLRATRATQAARIANLKTALLRYGRHLEGPYPDDWCPATRLEGPDYKNYGPCECGLDTAMAGDKAQFTDGHGNDISHLVDEKP